MKIEEIFKKGIELNHYANTAYPLDGKKVWKDYKVPQNLIDKEIENQWADIKELGLYVHIPFCKKRCLYCEYAVLSGKEANLKEEYVSLLIKEIKKYEELFKENPKTAIGLDLGGGTPSIVSVDSIDRIVNTILNGYNLADNFSISIETTPQIANDFEKINAIRKLGIERISMGMQTINPKLLEHVGRIDNSIEILKKARDNIKEAGFERFNIDLMYGFADQSIESFASTVQFAIQLNPEYITLYRNRYKGTRLEKEASKVTLEQVNSLYDTAYNLLIQNGFDANIGKNTFSRIKGDPGTSAYLTKRVIEGIPYLGIGLGAQSLASKSLYYNQGAASKKLIKYRKLIQENHFPIQDLYVLPIEEIMAKVICVSFYFGYINKEKFREKFKIGLEEQFGNEVDFLLKNNLMENKGALFTLTKKGKDVMNGIIPLFYSKNSKENLMNKVIKNV
jgi:oxygen-independent coproporphyrinogen-3 oxidase